MVEVGTGTTGTKELKRDWPHESGLEAGTERQEGRTPILEAEHCLVPKDELEGL